MGEKIDKYGMWRISGGVGYEADANPGVQTQGRKKLQKIDIIGQTLGKHVTIIVKCGENGLMSSMLNINTKMSQCIAEIFIIFVQKCAIYPFQ